MSKKENLQAKEYYETVRRYQEVNDKIDARLIEKGLQREDFIHGGEYATLFLHPDYEEKWKGTFYDKERFLLSTVLNDTYSLSHYHYLTSGKYTPNGVARTSVTEAKIIGYCDYAMGSEDGPVIHLVDPYGEVTLPPFYGMPSHMSLYYSGKMLIVAAEFLPDAAPYITEVFVLSFSLRRRLTKEEMLFSDEE